MTRIKVMLAAAAALILAGTGVGVALRLAGQAEGVTCPQWCSAVDRLADRQQHQTFFLAVANGTEIPKAYGDRVLGDCAAGECRLEPQGCPCVAAYSYSCGPLVNGWRVCTVKAPPYFAGGWRSWAQANPTVARWYDSYGQVVQACLAHFSGADCLDLLGPRVEKCWLLDTGDICRYGRLVRTRTPGDPTPLACPYARVVAPFPCEVSRGAGSEWADVQRVFSEEEYEAP